LELYHKRRLFEAYRRLVFEDLATLEPVPFVCFVTREYVFDFVIFYESLVSSWSFYPFVVHAFVVEQETHERLTALGLERAQIHLIPGDAGDWATNSAMRVRLIEQSGLERGIVSDVDNVFVAETPELFMLLNEFDFVFIGGPPPLWPIQASLWGFRSNPRSRQFARLWQESTGKGRFAEASGLPFALLENPDDQLKVKVLAQPKPESNDSFHPTPYDVQANMRPFVLTADALGFREREMGRAKVVHLAGLHAKGNTSVAARLDAVVECFPESSDFLPWYARLANAAASRLGIETVPQPNSYLRDRMYLNGVLPRRGELPMFLNRRGLVGRGAEIGVADGRFSERILRTWKGRELVSIDPWKEAPAEEYVDVSNLSQAEHDEFYAKTRRRLAQFGERSSIWRMTSEEAAARVTPHSFDFVYLDARHDYESVKRDLELWYEKIRPGGVFAGHDYRDGVFPQGVFGVKSAVDEFFGAKGIPVRTTHADAPWSSWVVDIPEAGDPD